MRTKQFNLRMTEAEFDTLAAKAETLGVSKNQLIIDAIAAYEGRGRSNTTINNTTTVDTTTSDRLSQLEQQMKQVLRALAKNNDEALIPNRSATTTTDTSQNASSLFSGQHSEEVLKLNPKPELDMVLPMVDTTVEKAIVPAAKEVAISDVPDTLPSAPKAPSKPKPGTKITTDELANIYCIDPKDIWDNLEEFKQSGVEDDYGNTWHYRNDADRWLLFTPQPQTKAKAKSSAKTKPSIMEAEDDDTSDRVIAAKRQFTEWTGLEATEFNGQRIIKGYYLGETIKFSNPEAWIVLVNRLNNYIPRVHTFPMPASADELDIQTIGVGNFGKIVQGLELKD